MMRAKKERMQVLWHQYSIRSYKVYAKSTQNINLILAYTTNYVNELVTMEVC